MFQHPDYRTVSLRLSEVLSDIGVHKRMLLKRRRTVLLAETIMTTTYRLLGKKSFSYRFGSKSEGSTTIGLNSDSDTLICWNTFNVIQDWSEWQPGIGNLLMIQDETTSPGYCLLQMLRDDEPLPFPISFLEHIPNSGLKVSRGMILMKNSVYKDVTIIPGLVINGPAQSTQGRPRFVDQDLGLVINGPAQSTQGRPGFVDQDFVQGFHCKSWPVVALPWLVRQGTVRWPTEEMKRYCEATGCFLVPVNSKSGLYEDLEWRISTSQAERCLMFSLNITQIQCYILMKMILKTFINPQCDGVLSSFMCKTVLFHCIQNTNSSNWQQRNLLPCLTCCLIVLQNFVTQENCPHFIIPENNLMAGRLSLHNKHTILSILQNIIQSEGRALLQIPIDYLGMRLQMKMNMAEAFQYWRTPAQTDVYISTEMLLDVAKSISFNHRELLSHIMHDGNETVQERLSDFILTLTRTYTDIDSNSLGKSTFKILTPPLSSSLGSVTASHNIYTTHRISPEALACFSVGLNSDVASGRLKLASALYCVGYMERTESVLRNTEGKYDLNTVEPVCDCYDHGLTGIRLAFRNRCNTGNEELIRHVTAFCVRFLRCETNCVPKELQYEMYRSTQEDLIHRDERFDFWMDWTVVDSLPYLYFLQYKTYRALQREADQQCAIANLARTIDAEPNLYHRETALNILGQCMEQENQHVDALRCYMKSLNIRARNNAAKVLICRLLNELVNMQQTELN